MKKIRYISLICVAIFIFESAFAISDSYRDFLKLEKQTRVEQAKFLSRFINTGSKPIETLEYLLKDKISKADKSWLKKNLDKNQIDKNIVSYQIDDTVYVSDSKSKLTTVRFAEIYPNFVLQINDKVYSQDHSIKSYKKLIEQLGNPKKNVSFNSSTNLFYLVSILLPEAEAYLGVTAALALGLYGVARNNEGLDKLDSSLKVVGGELNQINGVLSQLNKVQKQMVEQQKTLIEIQKQQVQLSIAQVDDSALARQAKRDALNAYEKELLGLFSPMLDSMQKYMSEDDNLSLLSCKERGNNQTDYLKISTKFPTDSNGLSITRSALGGSREKIIFTFNVNNQSKNFDFYSISKDNKNPKFDPFNTISDKTDQSACIDECSKNQTNLSLALLQRNRKAGLDLTQINALKDQLIKRQKVESNKRISTLDCNVGQPLAYEYFRKLQVHVSDRVAENQKIVDAKVKGSLSLSRRQKRELREEYCLDDQIDYYKVTSMQQRVAKYQSKSLFSKLMHDSKITNICDIELYEYLNTNPMSSEVQNGLKAMASCEREQRHLVKENVLDDGKIKNAIQSLESLLEDDQSLTKALENGDNEFAVGKNVNSFMKNIVSLKSVCTQIKLNCKNIFDQSKWTHDYMSDVVTITKVGAISQLASSCCSEPYCGEKLRELKSNSSGGRTTESQNN